jgi:hypothetical protein
MIFRVEDALETTSNWITSRAVGDVRDGNLEVGSTAPDDDILRS